MLLDGALGDPQLAGDAGVGPALGHELEDLALRGVRSLRGSWTRRAATSSFTNAGSMTEPPPAIRSSVSRKSSTSVTRLFSR